MDAFKVITACGLALALAVIMAAIDRLRERRLVSTRPMPVRLVRRGAGAAAGRPRIAPPKDRAA
jgi:hypothetical protein